MPKEKPHGSRGSDIERYLWYQKEQSQKWRQKISKSLSLYKQGYWSKEQCILPAKETSWWPHLLGSLEILLNPELLCVLSNIPDFLQVSAWCDWSHDLVFLNPNKKKFLSTETDSLYLNSIFETEKNLTPSISNYLWSTHFLN